MPGPGTETEALILRQVLRMLAVVFLAGGIILVVADQGCGSSFWILRIGLLTILAAGTLVLFLGSRQSLTVLRVLEWVVFGAVIGILMVRDQETLLILPGMTEPERKDLLTGMFSRMVSQFVLLALAYAIFIPNRLVRAIPLISLCILAPLAGMAIACARQPFPAGIPGLHRTGFSLVILFIGAVMSLVAAKLTHFLLNNVIEARGKFMYELVQKIGSGGMGEVWLGKHEMLSRPVAIKWILPEALASGDREETRGVIRRFVLEADATASLRSPHTIEVYDFGVTKGEIFYYSMEYLEGFDLQTLVERYGPVEPERAVHFLVQTCESLAEAHGRDMLHRDIKPANLYATHLGNIYDFVKVLDFGLVKPPEMPSADLKFDREGVTTGTPAYMAPEMFKGLADLSNPVDIYALGCVAYWLLTGSIVFDESTPLNMALAHISTEPIPPSERSELEVPEELDRIVLKCLEKDPARRYQFMEELAEVLRSCRLPADWSSNRALSWWQTHQPQKKLVNSDS